MLRSLILIGAVACSSVPPAVDTSTFDTGTPDTGTAPTEPTDSGASDTGASDSGASDTGTCVPRRWWRDTDHDGAGDPDLGAEACQAPPGHVANDGDCDDTDADRFPGNPERCDGIDQDCDATVDNGLVFTGWLPDADGDGYGAEGSAFLACEAPAGMVGNDEDCDDTNPDTFPGNPERCDGIDQDCFEGADNGLPFASWWPDADGDGWGDAAQERTTCDGAPAGWISVGQDCDDAAPAVHPGADPSDCDRVDTDCDGVVEEQRVPEDHADLQAAIDAAFEGDLVCVAAGTYATEAIVDGKTLVLRGEGTVLEGTGAVVLSLVDAGATEVSGFTITGAEGEGAVGLHIVDSEPTLRELEITDNHCVSDTFDGSCIGVGISIEGSSATLENVVISDNSGDARSYVWGAGLYVLESEVTLEDVIVSGNVGEAEYVDGVGIGVDSGSTLEADRLWLLDNVGFGTARGVALSTCLFSDAYDARVDLADVTVEGTDASLSGNSSVLDLCIGPDDPIVRLTARGNQANTLIDGWEPVIHNLLAVENESFGPMFDTSDALTLEQATIADNEVHETSTRDPHLFGEFGLYNLRNSIVSDNRWDFGAPHPPYPIATTFGGGYSVRYSDLYQTGALPTGMVGALGNIAVDPLFDADWRPLSLDLVDAGEPGSVDADGTDADLGAWGGPYADIP